MASEFIWRIPTRGDGRYADAKRRLRGERDPRATTPALGEGVTDPRGARFNYFDHVHQIARAAELATFEAVEVEHDPRGDESWIVSGYVARATRSAQVITEFEASWGTPVYAAKNAVSYQRFSGGRAAWHLVAGAGEEERRRQADPVPDADVAARIDEFLTVARGVITQAPYSFSGRFFAVQDGGFRGELANHPVPRIFLDGDTDERLELSARHADVHVFAAGSVDEVADRVAALRAREVGHAAYRAGRPLTFGLRIDLLARETEREARFDADRLAEQVGVARSAEEGLHRIGLTSELTRAHATLVGSYDQVAARLGEYANAGVTSFLLGAVPHLEEAYRVGTHVLPRARAILASTRNAA